MWGSHNGGYGGVCLLGYKAAQPVEYQLIFRRHNSDPSSGSSLLPASNWFLACLILPFWRWRRHVPPKFWFTFSGLYDVVSQKIELLIQYCIYCLIFRRPVISFVSVINENRTLLLSQNRKKRIPKYVQPLLFIIYIVALAFRAECGVSDRWTNLSPVFCVSALKRALALL
jgi:hypothetical protein